MIRYVLSVLIVIMVFMLVVFPLIKSIRKGMKRGGKLIEQTFVDEVEKPEKEKSKT